MAPNSSVAGWTISSVPPGRSFPSVLGQYLSDPDPGEGGRVAQAMMQMVKFDIAGLKAAYDG